MPYGDGPPPGGPPPRRPGGPHRGFGPPHPLGPHPGWSRGPPPQQFEYGTVYSLLTPIIYHNY